MKRVGVAVAILGLSVTLALLAHTAEPAVEPAGDAASQIKALQAERIETLARLVQLCVEEYKIGRASFESVARAETELIAAKLDATADRAERVALLTEQLKMVSALVEVTQRRHEAGMCSETDLLRAKSLQIETKIKLLRERNS